MNCCSDAACALPLVSVVVPVYNVADYLDACLETICAQTYRNLEILVVDDGSTDGSGALCDAWAGRDVRITVFHKKNGGLSDARNFALDRLHGAYVMFVDSDDYVAPNLTEYLLGLMRNLRAEISICDPVHCFPGERWEFSSECQKKALSCEEAICELLYQKSFLVSAWGKLFDVSCFADIRFPKGKLFEDSAVMYRVFEKASCIAYGDARLYAYRHRDNSITTSGFGARDLDMWETCKEIEQHYASASPGLRAAARSYRLSSALRVVLNAPEGQFEDVVQECACWARKNACAVMLDGGARRKSRLAAALFCFARPLMRPLYRRVDRWR